LITIVKVSNISIDGTAVFEFRCKSSDDKPVGFYDVAIVGNGSTLTEMDTSKVYMFDGENQSWGEL